ncbi:hypothetical protein [Sphingomonas sp. T9W2]|uniref:hypothetical protein n=1 Tax=Sphingomonas sp. T9W2 TaxID=3143183 RepID=UPI0031F5B87E
MSVVSLMDRLAAKRAAHGGEIFMLCPCQAQADDPAGFYPVVAHDARGIVLSSLVCMACEEPAYFNAGRILADGETA